MSVSSNLIGKVFFSSQVSEGTVNQTTDPVTFTETKLLADQKVLGSPLGPNATGTITNVVTSGGVTTVTAQIGNSGTFADGGTISGTLVGNDAGDFLIFGNVLGTQGYLFFTNTPGQQPGTTAPNNTATVRAETANVTYTPCFCAGTLILTERGEVAVENLAAGDRIVTVSGTVVPVTWIGFRHVTLAGHADRARVQPVRIAAGSFGADMPRRDLRLSPEHAVFTDRVLVAARDLVGCPGIDVDYAIDATTYYHVELPHHDVLLADGLPCESWLDTGNRAMFENSPIATLGFDETRGAASAWASDACAPLLTTGPALDTLRARLGAATTQDVFVATGGQHSFILPPGNGDVRILSHAHQSGDDVRRLGAAVSAIAVDGIAIDLADERLRGGFYGIDTAWRWTDGAGQLRLSACKSDRTLTVVVTAVATAVHAAA